MRSLSQYSSLRAISTYWPGTTRMILKGPVPIGFLANSAQFLPVTSHWVGLTMRTRVNSHGRKLNGNFVVMAMVVSFTFSNESTIETAAFMIGAAVASYCGDLSS